MLVRVFVCALALVAAVPACAVKVLPKTGEVRIGTGRGFQKVVAPTDVSAGAQIMVSPDGSAAIAYSDDCVVLAPPAAITVIENQPPCSDYAEPSYFGFAQSSQEGLSIDRGPFGFTPKVGAPDDDGGGGIVSGKKKPTAPAPLPPSTTTATTSTSGTNSLLIVGGVVVGVGALAAILAGSGGDGPASP